MAALLIMHGDQPGALHPITLPIVSIGRDDACTIQVLDRRVSRKHLQIRADTSNPARPGHLAGDYRSANGVLINGKPVLIDVRLADGDRITIGDTTLVYLAHDHPDAASAHAAAKKAGEWKRVTLTGD